MKALKVKAPNLLYCSLFEITSNRASVSFSYNVPSGQSLVPVSSVRESELFLNRMDKAATNFAKKVGPIAVGFAMSDTICNLTALCNIDDVWQKLADPGFIVNDKDINALLAKKSQVVLEDILKDVN